MNLDEYQEKALTSDLKAQVTDGRLAYLTLGLTGEAGEVAEKVKKAFRNNEGQIDKESIAKELGDVMWYTSVLAHYLGYKLSDIAKMNVEKLESRMKRDVLRSDGDDR